MTWLKKWWWAILAVLSAIAGAILFRRCPDNPTKDIKNAVKDGQKTIEERGVELAGHPGAVLDELDKRFGGKPHG